MSYQRQQPQRAHNPTSELDRLIAAASLGGGKKQNQPSTNQQKKQKAAQAQLDALVANALNGNRKAKAKPRQKQKLKPQRKTKIYSSKSDLDQLVLDSPQVSQKYATKAMVDASVLTRSATNRQARGSAYMNTLHRLSRQPNRRKTAKNYGQTLADVYDGTAKTPDMKDELDQKITDEILRLELVNESINTRLADAAVAGYLRDFSVQKGDSLLIDDDVIVVVPDKALNNVAASLVTNDLRFDPLGHTVAHDVVRSLVRTREDQLLDVVARRGVEDRVKKIRNVKPKPLSVNDVQNAIDQVQLDGDHTILEAQEHMLTQINEKHGTNFTQTDQDNSLSTFTLLRPKSSTISPTAAIVRSKIADDEAVSVPNEQVRLQRLKELIPNSKFESGQNMETWKRFLTYSIAGGSAVKSQQKSSLDATLSNNDIDAMTRAIEDGRLTTAHVINNDSIDVNYITDNGQQSTASVTLPELQGGWGLLSVVGIHDNVPDKETTQQSQSAIKEAVGTNLSLSDQQLELDAIANSPVLTMPELRSIDALGQFQEQFAVVEPIEQVEASGKFEEKTQNVVAPDGTTIKVLPIIGSVVKSAGGLASTVVSGIVGGLRSGVGYLPARETVGGVVGRGVGSVGRGVGAVGRGLGAVGNSAYNRLPSQESIGKVLNKGKGVSGAIFGTVYENLPSVTTVKNNAVEAAGSTATLAVATAGAFALTGAVVVTGGLNAFSWMKSKIIGDTTQTATQKAKKLVQGHRKLRENRLDIKEKVESLQHDEDIYAPEHTIQRPQTRQENIRIIQREERVLEPRLEQRQVLRTVRRSAAPELVQIPEATFQVINPEKERVTKIEIQVRKDEKLNVPHVGYNTNRSGKERHRGYEADRKNIRVDRQGNEYHGQLSAARQAKLNRQLKKLEY
jgi:hypothetical protein